MTKFDTSLIQWREPWQIISSDYAPIAEAELHSEMCAGHILFGRKVTAIGRRFDCDDVLFYLGDMPPRFAVVHLTFKKETSPDWPHASLFDSVETWLQQCMIPNAEEYVL